MGRMEVIEFRHLLPRDAMHSADYAVARCLSVRLPVCPAKRTFLRSGSHTILAFPHQLEWQYSDGDPLTGTSNAAV